MFGKKERKPAYEPIVEVLTPLPEENQQQSMTVTLRSGSTLALGNTQNQGKRPYQEDSYGYSNLTDAALVANKGVLAVVADGMGGLSHGKDVSMMTVSGMLEYFNAPGTLCQNGEQLFRRVREINEAVCNRFCSDGRINAGSTLVCALVNNNRLHWVCVGDSRLYLRRNGQIYQVNEDHDYLNRLLGEAVFEKEELTAPFSDPQKDVLVSCIGNRELLGDISKDGIALYPGDQLLLCSDGVYNAIPPEVINNLMQDDAQAAAEHIEAAVLAQGFRTQDNFTTIIINYN